ncbi:MAG: c-type cytochrome [Rubrivivax sp.]
MFLSVLCVVAPRWAAASPALAEEKQCLGCHALANDGAGPSFQRIGRAWRGHSDAEKILVRTIRRGSASTDGPHWDKATMPDMKERPLVNEVEAYRLARWILEQ